MKQSRLLPARSPSQHFEQASRLEGSQGSIIMIALHSLPHRSPFNCGASAALLVSLANLIFGPLKVAGQRTGAIWPEETFRPPLAF